MGSYKAYKYRLYQDSDIIECDFFILAGDDFYFGQLFHSADVDDVKSDEPDPIVLTDDEVKAFDSICSSLNI